MEDSYLDTTVDMQAALTGIEADQSILKAAIKLKYKHPTLVQSKLFELSQEKNHMIIKSKSRSGKTSGSLLVALHKMIQNIKKHKKHPHFMAIICPNKAVCNSNEALLEKALEYAKEDHNISYLNLTKTAYEIFENEMFIEAKKRLIIIGTPALFKKMFLSLPNAEHFHQHVETIFLDELNFMFSFGYEDDLHEIMTLYKERAEEIMIIFSLSNEDERIKSLKSLIMRNSVTLKFNDQTAAGGNQAAKSSIFFNEFYYMSDEMTKHIAIYILFKLKLIAGRTLIICQDIDEAYKMNAFIERAQIKTSKVYSPEWPLKVREYFLSVFNTGLVNILVSTTDIFEVGTQSVKNKNGLKEVDNIIVTNLVLVEDMYENLPEFLNAKKSIPCLIEFLHTDENSKEMLFELLEQNKSRNKANNIQELPVKAEQVKSFRYRCTDIYRSITNKQINILKTMDIKRQILKSKELKEYFDEHSKERDLIVHDIDKLAKQVSNHSVKMEETVPSYLTEGFETKPVVAQEESKQQKRRKIVLTKYNEDYESSLAKRMAGNNLSLEDVKKKRKMEGDKYIYVNDEKEDPILTDATRLTPLSNRKMWKIKHKKGLKKINKRLERKGIFTS